MDLEVLLRNYEETIRLGEISGVQDQIEKLNPNSIPRKLIAAYADIARRVRCENWGLRLLQPIIRSEVPVHPKPSEEELCTYAGLLIKVGAVREAQEILLKLDRNKLVNVNAFLAQIHVAQWNYREAVPLFIKVLSRKGTSEYQGAVAQVNLVAAYIFLEKFTEATVILPQLLQRCLDNKWELLYANALEISAQLAVIQQDWVQAQSLLKEAEHGAGQHTHYRIFIDKWKVLAEFSQAQDDVLKQEQAKLKIARLREKAQALRSWETVRDLDFYLALYQNHENLLLNVYFGTPHAAYKKRIEKIFKARSWQIPDFYYRKLTTAPAERVLNLETAEESGVFRNDLVKPVKPGQMLYRLLNILAMDFYKPTAVGELFSRLFPGEYFNPDLAPGRVAQAIKLLRKWFKLNHIPIDIKTDSNRFYFVATAPYAFKISKTVRDVFELQNAGFAIQLKHLKFRWPYQSFSASEAAQLLEISASGARKLLARANKQREVFTSGAGRSTQYRFQK